MVLHSKSTLCIPCLRGWLFHATLVFNCNILKGDLYIDVSIRSSFRFAYILVFWCVRERQGSQFSLVASEDVLGVCFVRLVVGGNYVWYNCHIDGIWTSRAKRCGGRFKVINQSDKASDKRVTLFIGNDGFSLCNTAVL